MNRHRVVAGGAALGACCALAHHIGPPQRPPDFLQWWTAARAVWHGQNAYQAVRALGLPWPFFYPLTAALPVLAVAPLPLIPAHIVWSALAGALLGRSARVRPALGPALLSASFFGVASEGHWSAFLAAAAVLPWLGFVWVAKPSVGLAYLAGWPSRSAVIGCTLLVALSLAVAPHWPFDWVQVLRGGTLSLPPITRPGGFLLLLGFIRWRTPEGRLLGAFALVPQTTVAYEALAVFLCAKTREQGYVLAVLSWIAVYAHYFVYGIPDTVEAQAATLWPFLLAGCYLPALVLTLRTPMPSPSSALPPP